MPSHTYTSYSIPCSVEMKHKHIFWVPTHFSYFLLYSTQDCFGIPAVWNTGRTVSAHLFYLWFYSARIFALQLYNLSALAQISASIVDLTQLSMICLFCLDYSKYQLGIPAGPFCAVLHLLSLFCANICSSNLQSYVLEQMSGFVVYPARIQH